LCPNCRRGDEHVCQQAATTGLGLGANPGGYAESVVVQEEMLVPIPDDELLLLIKEGQIRASFAYWRDEFTEAVELLAAGKLPTDRLITGTAPLEHAQKMFDLLEDPDTEQIKILLAPRLD
jgi:threonine dehydrogenase-like Zn-dependent dehydrogenase